MSPDPIEHILVRCLTIGSGVKNTGVPQRVVLGQQQAASNKLDKTSRIIYDGDIMTNMKQELKKINDELMELYNKPSMALHFQPTNLRVLRRLITKLVLLEKEDEKN